MTSGRSLEGRDAGILAGIFPLLLLATSVAGVMLGLAGAVLALWCVSEFVFFGRGTPAPFAPPRRLVTHGPYRFVRNPMYIGGTLILAGAAVFYKSLPLLGYTCLFVLASHLFVVWYEEPTLRRTFGHEYEAYCSRVRRWRPRVGNGGKAWGDSRTR